MTSVGGRHSITANSLLRGEMVLTSSCRLMIIGYQVFLRPFLAGPCRFYPSCSEYAQEAFQTWGFWAGFKLTVFRVLRCNPIGKCGVDLVPAKLSRGIIDQQNDEALTE